MTNREYISSLPFLKRFRNPSVSYPHILADGGEKNTSERCFCQKDCIFVKFHKRKQ